MKSVVKINLLGSNIAQNDKFSLRKLQKGYVFQKSFPTHLI